MLCCVFIWINAKEPYSNLGLTIFGSALTSLVISLAFMIIKEEKREPIEKKFPICIKTELGIIECQEKGAYKPEFWINLISITNYELIISGKSLVKWQNAPFKNAFEDNVKRIVQNGGKISILLFSAPKKEDELGESINDLLGMFNNINGRGTIVVKLLNKELNYMLNKFDNRLLLSPYAMNPGINGKSLLIDFLQESPYAIHYYNDFYKVFNDNKLCEDIYLYYGNKV